MKSSYTSETDKQLLNTGLDNLAAAKTKSSANSAVATLKETITATQKRNKPAEDKAKAEAEAEAEKKAAEATKAAAEKAEVERKAAEKAEADRKAAEVVRQRKLKQQMLITLLLVNGRLKMAILGIHVKVIVQSFLLAVVYLLVTIGKSLNKYLNLKYNRHIKNPVHCRVQDFFDLIYFNKPRSRYQRSGCQTQLVSYCSSKSKLSLGPIEPTW